MLINAYISSMFIINQTCSFVRFLNHSLKKRRYGIKFMSRTFAHYIIFPLSKYFFTLCYKQSFNVSDNSYASMLNGLIFSQRIIKQALSIFITNKNISHHINLTL